MNDFLRTVGRTAVDDQDFADFLRLGGQGGEATLYTPDFVEHRHDDTDAITAWLIGAGHPEFHRCKVKIAVCQFG